MKLAIVGIQGLPNKYGGFETLASFLALYLSDEHAITVYCSAKDMPLRSTEYNGAKLLYFPFSSHGMQGMIYDMLCLHHAVKNNDVVLFVGFGAGFLMPFLSKKSKQKIVLNFGGLDWQRNKWDSFSKAIIRVAEKLLVKNAGQIIADNPVIAKYILTTYQKSSVFIAYGGDQVFKQAITEDEFAKYPFLQSAYAFAVCRIQPDNNVLLLLEAFLGTKIPLVLVGNWNDSAFGRTTLQAYKQQPNLFLLEAIYDQETLNMLRSNCVVYIHGHSAGGTNPSLVEAMHLTLPIFAYASGYNETTTEGYAQYFSTIADLKNLVNVFDSKKEHLAALKMKEIATQKYTWQAVTNAYNNVFKQQNA
jgi:glycosyltransferase involved in cell wall biosynthesis